MAKDLLGEEIDGPQDPVVGGFEVPSELVVHVREDLISKIRAEAEKGNCQSSEDFVNIVLADFFFDLEEKRARGEQGIRFL